MMKKRSRDFFIKTARKINSKLLRFFKTCDLIAALESREDVCETRYVPPDAKYLVDTNWGCLPKESILEQGPAVILVVID